MMIRRAAVTAIFMLAVSLSVAAKVIGTMVPAESITDARIDRLPLAEQAVWHAYLETSRTLMAADKAALAAERRRSAPANYVADRPLAGNGMPMGRPLEWYGSAEARRIADTIVSFQTPAGGWGKNQNRSGPPRLAGQSWVLTEKLPAYAVSDIQSEGSWRYVGTIDNDATVAELRFLARVQSRLPGVDGAPYRAAFEKGVRYLLAAQFPNGGWPQVFPLQGGYHDAVTFNDNALVQVAALMEEVGRGEGDFASVPAELASLCRQSVERATSLILRTQIVIDGKRTIWGQQHDALTLVPVGARNFEPAALATTESVAILTFLMRRPQASSDVRAAIRDGVEWLAAHSIRDAEWRRAEAPEGNRLLPRPGAGPIWARFYDVSTGLPIYGDRDRSIHDDVNLVSLERRNGYSWFTTSPATLIPAYSQSKVR